MKAFLALFIVLAVLQSIGKALILLRHETTRNLSYTPWDIGLLLIQSAWAAYLLGGLP